MKDPTGRIGSWLVARQADRFIVTSTEMSHPGSNSVLRSCSLLAMLPCSCVAAWLRTRLSFGANSQSCLGGPICRSLKRQFARYSTPMFELVGKLKERKTIRSRL
jgi:hypothetical protein